MNMPDRHTGHTANQLIDEANQEPPKPSTKKPETPLHDIMCGFSRDDVKDACADILLPQDDEGLWTLWCCVRGAEYAREGMPTVPALLDGWDRDIGRMVRHAAEQFFRDKANEPGPDYARGVWEQA